MCAGVGGQVMTPALEHCVLGLGGEMVSRFGKQADGMVGLNRAK